MSRFSGPCIAPPIAPGIIRLPLSFLASRPRRAPSPTETPRPPNRVPPRLIPLAILLLTAATLAAQLPAPAADPHLAPPSNRIARATRFARSRRTADATSPALALANAQADTLALAADRAAHPAAANLTAAWSPLGPSSLLSASYGNVTGRVSAVALDPNDPAGNTLYLGTTGGGVWKSTNAAGPLATVTFAPLTDDLPVFSPNSGSGVIPSLSIGALAVQPATHPVLLAGTGDPNDATDSLYGQGLLRSTDGGATWTLLQTSHDGVNGNHSFLGMATAGIAFSTANPTLVVAAFSTSGEGAIVNANSVASIPGLYYSTDAGQTWQMASLYDGTQVVQTPEPYSPGQVGNPATAVVYNPQRALFFAAVRYHGVYSSPDGITWKRLSAQPGVGLTTAACPSNPESTGSTRCPIFRGALAVQPATGDLYALSVDASDLDQGLWQDLCHLSAGVCTTPAPTFSNRIDNAAFEVGFGSTAIAQGTYNLTLAAAPTTAAGTLLFAGTIDLYRCALNANATSCAWRNTTNAVNGCAAPAAVAPAQHALAALAQTSGNPLLFLGNDSGLWRSTDGVAETGPPCSASDATHFDNLNAAIATGGSLAEIVGFAQDPTSPNTLLAGLGQNGSGVTSTASTPAAWPQLSAGEGGFPLLDPNTPANWLLAIGAEVNLKLCTQGVSCTAAGFVPPATIGEPQVANDAAELDAPTLLDPVQSSSVLTATCRVWRGPATNSPAWSTTNALSAPFDRNAVPCSASSALVRSLAAAGPAASSANPQNAGSTVLYAGLSGALDGGAAIAGHLFVTTAANTASTSTRWTDAALAPVTNSPYGFNPGSFDVSALAADPHDPTGATVYATIMGFGQPHLYGSTDFGAHWTNLSANLPNAPANAVLVDPNDANTVYVALDTGVFVTTAITTCPTANCWSLLGTGLPNSPITSLAAAPSLPVGDGRLGLLRAGTYGRGLWSTPLLTAAIPLAPALTAAPTSLTFAAQLLNTASPAQTITLTSAGNTAVTLGAISVPSPFAIAAGSDHCSNRSLAAGTSCTVAVVFTPVATGAASGQLTVPANISGGSLVIPLNGTGIAPASDTLTPLALTFPTQQVGLAGAPQTATLTNSGDVPLAISSIASSTTEFAVTSTCGASLAAHSACTLSIVFTPANTGLRTGSVTVTDALHTQTISLTGTGAAPPGVSLNPAALVFAATLAGAPSPPQTLTLLNNGSLPLTLSGTSVTPGFSIAATTCAASLAPAASCTLAIVFTPPATGTFTGSLAITDNAPTSPQTVSLTGVGATAATATLSALALTFPTTTLGATSPAQTLTLTNAGGLPLAIASTILHGPFVLASTTCGVTLAANASCTLGIAFAPSAAGASSGSLALTTSAVPATQTIALNGTGQAPATIVLLPAALTFPATLLGQTSATQVVTVSNTGGVAATLQTPTITGDFAIANNTCGVTLAPSTGCSIALTFTPTASGARNGTLTVPTSAGTQTAALAGTGNSAASDTLSPLALTFPLQQVGLTSAPLQVTLTNTGDTALTLIAAAASTSEFGVTNYCGASLAAHATCAIAVTFTPTATGARSGILTVTDILHTQTVTLNGTAAAPAGVSLTPASLNFGAVAVGSTAVTQPLTLTNNGGFPLTLNSATVSGPFTIAATTCTASLAPGAACAWQIAFTPLAAGTAAGAFTLVSSATPSTQVIPLNATGVDFTLTATGPTSLTVSSGQVASYALQLSSPATLSGAVALACTGAPAHSTCVVTPSSASLGVTLPIAVTVTTGTAALRPGPPLPWQHTTPILFAIALPCALLARRRRTRGLIPLALVAALLTTAGCGAGRTIPPGAIPIGTPTPTAGGSYTLTVSATSSGITHTVPLTLIVQ